MRALHPLTKATYRPKPDASVAERLALLGERLSATAYWRCRREECNGTMADPAHIEVVETRMGLALVIVVPRRHRGHAITLELPPIVPEAMASDVQDDPA